MRAVRTGTGRLRQGFSVLTPPMTSIVGKTNMIELAGFVYNRYELRKVFSVSYYTWPFLSYLKNWAFVENYCFCFLHIRWKYVSGRLFKQFIILSLISRKMSLTLVLKNWTTQLVFKQSVRRCTTIDQITSMLVCWNYPNFIL